LSDEPDVEDLCRLAQEVAAEWGIELGPRFVLSRYSFVAPAGEDAVLKLTPAGDDESDEEAEALELWDGDGAVRLLRRDRARRALLLERARPGTDISALPEGRATEIAVEVGLRLWRQAGEPFRWIGDHVPRWLANVERSGEQSAELLGLARGLYDSLEVRRSTLVHGDFHHHNILAAGAGRHLAIDPKPMLGEPEFDVPPLLWNPIGATMRLDVVERRLAAFAAAGLDQERMRAWSAIRGAYLGAGTEDAAVLRALL
jgi:streptomycin 6-kinase